MSLIRLSFSRKNSSGSQGIRVLGIRTSSRSSRHTLASRTVNSASILLERLLGDTACAVGSLTVLKDSAGGVADVFDVGDGGGGDGDEAEEEGCDGELHFDGRFFGVVEVCWFGVLVLSN